MSTPPWKKQQTVLDDFRSHQKRFLHHAATVLPEGQYRALSALVGTDEAPTYREAAQTAGVAVTTLYTHLERIRKQHPAEYGLMMMLRKAQLGLRHETAEERERVRSEKYLKRRSSYRYYRKHGRWPWDKK